MVYAQTGSDPDRCRTGGQEGIEMTPRRQCRVRDVIQAVSEIAPPRLAESWDNVGLQVGDPGRPVTRIMTCLEVTENTIDEALRLNADLIIAHHPLIFKPISVLDQSEPAGSLIAGLVRHEISVIAAHTNLDSACWSTNSVLAEMLGFESRGPLVPAPDEDPETSGGKTPGLGLRTLLDQPLITGQLADHVKQRMGLDRVRISGPEKQGISKVAICTGSGGSFICRASMVADAYVTGEISYHHAVEAAQRKLSVIELGHYESEVVVVGPLAKKLSALPVLQSCKIEVLAANEDFQPFRSY
jgi:dinuclear metal center YbgI/SA1388 family protein